MSDAYQIELLPFVPRAVARALGINWYYSAAACPKGHITKRSISSRECRHCVDLKRAESRKVDPDRARTKDREKYHRNPERERFLMRAAYGRYAEKRREYGRTRYLTDPVYQAKAKLQASQWWKLNDINRGKANYRTAKRRAWIKQATPPWITKDQKRQIRQFYIDASCREGDWDVDHIYPLRAKNSCGLNVPWNLQILTTVENRRKQNRMPKEGAQ